MSGRNAWIEEADALLSDGQWHDGLAWVRNVEKHIMPGVAQRQSETARIRMTLARRRRRLEQKLGRSLTPEELANLEIPERVRPLSVSAQIAAGKRAMVQELVHARVRYGALEVDPWPIPRGGWKQGGWKIRYPLKSSMKTLEDRFHITGSRIREMVLQEPALRYEIVGGRLMYLPEEELPKLVERIEAYRAASHERRANAVARSHEIKRNQPVTHYSISRLADRSNLAVITAQQLSRANPDLGWVRRGRNLLLPLDQVPAWEQIVEKYRSEARSRRSEAARRSAQTRREQRTAD